MQWIQHDVAKLATLFWQNTKEDNFDDSIVIESVITKTFIYCSL
jgi:hypothetical protein